MSNDLDLTHSVAPEPCAVFNCLHDNRQCAESKALDGVLKFFRSGLSLTPTPVCSPPVADSSGRCVTAVSVSSVNSVSSLGMGGGGCGLYTV